MLPILQVGPLALPLPPLLILIAFWLGANLSERRAPRHGIQANLVGDLLFYGLIAGILAARLGYALRFPSAFIDSPASLISTNLDLFDIWGGLAGALIFGLAYALRKEMALWPTLDAITPFLAAMALGIPLANLAAGSAYGLPAELPWAIELWGQARHPVQVYEALAAALILWAVMRTSAARRIPGDLFLNFVMLSAAALLLLGAFRAEGSLLPNGWRTIQVLAWFVAAGAWQLLRTGVLQRR